MPITSEQLDALENLAKAATPGPWRVGKGYAVVCDPHHPRAISGAEDVEYYGGGLVGESIQPSDSAYIAAASPDVALRLVSILRAALTWADAQTKAGDSATLSRECDVAMQELYRLIRE